MKTIKVNEILENRCKLLNYNLNNIKLGSTKYRVTSITDTINIENEDEKTTLDKYNNCTFDTNEVNIFDNLKVTKITKKSIIETKLPNLVINLGNVNTMYIELKDTYILTIDDYKIYFELPNFDDKDYSNDLIEVFFVLANQNKRLLIKNK